MREGTGRTPVSEVMRKQRIGESVESKDQEVKYVKRYHTEELE